MRKATEVGDGIYKLDTRLKEPGVYYFFISSKAGKLDTNDAIFLSVQAAPASATN